MNLPPVSLVSCQKSCSALCIPVSAGRMIIHCMHQHRQCDNWTRTYHISLTYFNHDVPTCVHVKKLENRVAVITGATSGMALATAKLFVEEGAYVFVTGRSQERLDKAAKEIGKNVIGVQGDAGNLSDLDRLFEIVKKEKGRIDVLFASAGYGELSKPL